MKDTLLSENGVGPIGPGQLSKNEVIPFILAGKAWFSICNPKTKVRFTYKVTRSKPRGISNESAVYFVSTNTDGWKYLGILMSDSTGKKVGFRTTAKTMLPLDAIQMKAIRWFLGKLFTVGVPDSVEVWHDGRCGRCGMHLIDPKSVAGGFGPHCLKMMRMVNGAVNQMMRNVVPVSVADVLAVPPAESGEDSDGESIYELAQSFR